jgi:hypothetical protein
MLGPVSGAGIPSPGIGRKVAATGAPSTASPPGSSPRCARRSVSSPPATRSRWSVNTARSRRRSGRRRDRSSPVRARASLLGCRRASTQERGTCRVAGTGGQRGCEKTVRTRERVRRTTGTLDAGCQGMDACPEGSGRTSCPETPSVWQPVRMIQVPTAASGSISRASRAGRCRSLAAFVRSSSLRAVAPRRRSCRSHRCVSRSDRRRSRAARSDGRGPARGRGDRDGAVAFGDVRSGRQAIELGDVDLHLAYTGEAWLDQLGSSGPSGGSGDGLAAVARDDASRGIAWLTPRFGEGGWRNPRRTRPSRSSSRVRRRSMRTCGRSRSLRCGCRSVLDLSICVDTSSVGDRMGSRRC